MIDGRHLTRLPMFDDRGLPRNLGLDVRHVQGVDVRHVQCLDVRDVQGLDVRHVHGLDVRHVQGLDVRDAHQVQLALQTPAAPLAAASHARACARSDFCRGPRPDRRGPMVAAPVSAPAADPASLHRSSPRVACRLSPQIQFGSQRHSHGAASGCDRSSGCAGCRRTKFWRL